MEFQSTHPRRVWLLKNVLYVLRTIVSIHTPTQGVTCKYHRVAEIVRFQSTHPRRVWLEVCFLWGQTVKFQSTHPRRVWLCIFSCLMIANSVSIHTPTQGVTGWMCHKWQIYLCFNPHTHAGCDLAVHLACRDYVFQSTHPRRVWREIAIYFGEQFKVSIHTPTQGVTALHYQKLITLHVSIHTPTQGVTKTKCKNKWSWMFQSTHPRRVWLCN